MVDWKCVGLDLAGDIRIGPTGAASRYHSATPHYPWSPVDGVDPLLASGEYYQLECKCPDGAVHYRQLCPDWPTLKEWFRVYFNELEVHELDPEKYPVYQTITGCLIEGGSAGDVQSDIWFEVTESAPDSFRERILLSLFEEIASHGFPCEQGDDWQGCPPFPGL